MINKGNLIQAGERFPYPCDPTASWEEGMVAQLVDAGDGTPQVKPATGASGEVIIGMFWGNKATALTKVEVETVTFKDASNNPTLTVQLIGTSVRTAADSIRVTNPSTGAAYTITTHYTISAGGVLTRVNVGGGIPAGGQAVVRYERNILAAELPFVGVDYNRSFDDTAGFEPGYGGGLATILQGHHIVGTDMFEEGENYVVGQPVFVSARGRFSATSGTKQYPGIIHTPPSAQEPVLYIDAITPNVAL